MNILCEALSKYTDDVYFSILDYKIQRIHSMGGIYYKISYNTDISYFYEIEEYNSNNPKRLEMTTKIIKEINRILRKRKIEKFLKS